MSELGTILTNNIDNLLHRQGMTQRDLARKSGIPAATISNYITQRNYPRPAQMEKLAGALSVSAAYLTTKHDAKSATNKQNGILPKNGYEDEGGDMLLGKTKTFWQIMEIVDSMNKDQQEKVLSMIGIMNQ